MLPNDHNNDRIRYSITVLFSVTHCQCTCTYTIMANAKMTFLLYCHSSKCADEKEKPEYYCHSMSVYGYILSSDIYSVTTAIIYPVWVTTLLLPVVSCCQNHLGHFPWTRHGRKPEICCWNSDAIYRSSRDISTSGLGSYIAISGCQLSSKSSGGTFFLPVMVENPGLPL